MPARRSRRPLFGALFLLAAFVVVPALPTRARARQDRPVRSVLLVLAHPDDETCMGGTLGRLRELGIEVHALYATRGESGAIFKHRGGKWVEGPRGPKQHTADVRRREVRRALHWYGARDFVPLDNPDLALRDKDGVPTRNADLFVHGGAWNADRLKRDIEAYARRVKPDLVLTMLPDNPSVHAHHQAIARIAREMFVEGRLGPNVQQIYGTEETAWYPPQVFSAAPQAQAAKVCLTTARQAPRLGMRYNQFAERGSREHVSQWTGHMGLLKTDEVFVPLSTRRPDPLRAILNGRLPRASERRLLGDGLRRGAQDLRRLGPAPHLLGRRELRRAY